MSAAATALAGPAVVIVLDAASWALLAALGARGTLLASALATIALGLITTTVLTRARAQARTSPATPGPSITYLNHTFNRFFY